MKCVNCGSENAEGSKFCMKCGSALVDTQKVVSSQPTQLELNQNIEIPKKGNIKSIILIVIGLLVVGISIFAATKLFGKNENNQANEKEQEQEQAILTDDDYIVVENNGKYGIVDIDGNVVIPLEYDLLYGVYDGKFYGRYTEDGMEEAGIFDLKGNEVFEFERYFDDWIYVEKTGRWVIAGILYDMEFNQISKDSQYISIPEHYNYYSFRDNENNTKGIMDKDGKIIYQYNNDNSTESEYAILVPIEHVDGNNLCIYEIRKSSNDSRKTAIINCDSGEVIFDYVPASINAYYDNLFEVNYEDGSQSFEMVIINNKIVYQTNDNEGARFDDILNMYVITNKSLKEENDGYQKFINPLTGEITNEKSKTTIILPEDAETYNYMGYEKIKCNNDLYKLTTTDGQDITECIYSEIKPYDIDTYKYLETKGVQYLFGTRDNDTYLINATTGQEEYSFDSMEYNYQENSSFISFSNKIGQTEMFNIITGKSLAIDFYPSSSSNTAKNLEVFSNYMFVEQHDGTIKYYNKNFEVIYEGKSEQ